MSCLVSARNGPHRLGAAVSCWALTRQDIGTVPIVLKGWCCGE